MKLYIYHLNATFSNKRYQVIDNVTETVGMYKCEIGFPLFLRQINKNRFENGAYVYNFLETPVVILLEDDLDKAKKLSCDFILEQIKHLQEQITVLQKQQKFIMEYGVNK